jgi:hypothetical protein
MHFEHVILASRFIGHLLFSKYLDETLENLKSMLCAGDAFSRYLFECYIHFLFEHGHSQLDRLAVCTPLTSLNLLLMGSLAPRDSFDVLLPLRKVEVFDEVLQVLSGDTYYIPLSLNFPAVDALTKTMALQCCVIAIHPVKGVRLLQKVAALYARSLLPLVFIVPESIFAEFNEQKILTPEGADPVNPPLVHQLVLGIPLGIDTTSIKTRRKVILV